MKETELAALSDAVSLNAKCEKQSTVTNYGKVGHMDNQANSGIAMDVFTPHGGVLTSLGRLAVAIGFLSMAGGCASGMYTSKVSGSRIKGGVESYTVVKAFGDKPTSFRTRNQEPGIRREERLAKERLAAQQELEERSYSPSTLPIIEEWKKETKDYEYEYSLSVLWALTLGIVPSWSGETVHHTLKITSPIGTREGTCSVSARKWMGWFALLMPIVCLADEYAMNPNLPNAELEDKAKDELRRNLVSEFSKEGYAKFAEAKNKDREMEVTHIKTVKQEINALLARHEYDAAEQLRQKEAVERAGTWRSDGKVWMELKTAIAAKKEAYQIAQKKAHLDRLLANGEFEKVLQECETPTLGWLSEGALLREYKQTACNRIVSDVNDPKRLVAFLKTENADGRRDEILKKLISLDSLPLLTSEELAAHFSKARDLSVLFALIEGISDRNALVQMLRDGLDQKLVRTMFAKIGDASLVRERVWKGTDVNAKLAYIDVFGDEAECARIVESYAQSLTDDLVRALKGKVGNKALIGKINAIQEDHLVAEISCLSGSNIVERIKSIPEQDVRERMALKMLQFLAMQVDKDGWFMRVDNGPKDRPGWGNLQKGLVGILSKECIASEAKKIIASCQDKIHFGGFYLGMSAYKYLILEVYYGGAPYTGYSSLWGDSWKFEFDNIRTMMFPRTLRYRIFEKEDGEFWSAYLQEYVPHKKKQESLTRAVIDALDKGTFDYQTGWNDELNEHCYIYKSMKYGTRVSFGEKTGALLLEEYK